MTLRSMGLPATLAVGCAFCVLAPAAPASAQVNVEVDVPSIAFDEDPGLVELEPGVSVVPDYGEEVFFVDGWYWHRWHGRWYHASDWRGGWALAPPPPRLGHIELGRYRNWHGGRVIRPGGHGVERAPHERYVAPPGPRAMGPRSRGVAPPPARSVAPPPPVRRTAPAAAAHVAAPPQHVAQPAAQHVAPPPRSPRRQHR